MYDVAIIGGGICGASVLYELSKYDVKACILEKENDIAMGTTKANSAIVHAGYDPIPGTLMAKYNVEGSTLIKAICHDLDVPYKQIGSLVIALSEEEMKTVNELYQRGLKNGVKELYVLTGQQVLEMEPNLNKTVKGALLAKTGAVVSPWGLTIALAETAVVNGTEVLTNSEVTSIDEVDGYYSITINHKKTIEAKYIVNCGGLFSDKIQAMASNGKEEFKIIPDKGQYFLLDKSQGDIVRHVIFQCPTKVGKGVLVSPTVGDNLIVGPDSQRVTSVENMKTERHNLDFIKMQASKTTDKINYRENIRNFAGVRAYSNFDDFIVALSKYAKNFVNVAGIKSPGLSSAPAIAKDVVKILERLNLSLKAKKSFVSKRKKIVFANLSAEEKQKQIKTNPLYGNVICRCNTITEGEIIDAIHSPIPPKTLDGIKRRCSTGMGRCQGGFCGPKIHEILSKELNLPMEDVFLEKENSYIVSQSTQKGKKNEN